MESISHLVLTLSPVIIAILLAFGIIVIFYYLTEMDIFPFGNLKAPVLYIFSILISLITLIGALLSAYLWWRDTWSKTGFLLPNLLHHAFAADSEQQKIAFPNYLGVMLTAILAVMLFVFLAAVGMSLILKDSPENASRRTSANDIVKTFNGFFIGILTAFLKQAIGAP